MMKLRISGKQTTEENKMNSKNWYDRIKAAQVVGHFTDEEQSLSGGWDSCACGEMDVRIPRGHRGDPKDEILCLYGMRFLSNVVNNDFAEAQQTLAIIEAREMELIADIERWKK